METVVLNKPVVKASEAEIGQAIPVNVPVEGEARIEPESEIEIVGRLKKEKADMMAFMEEPVTVIIHRSADKMSVLMPEVIVNGTVQRFIRGQKITVKRKFVDALARARDISYEQDTGVDRNTGQAMNRMIPMIGLKYPFDVLEDANPKGKEWLQNLLQEA